MKYAFVLLSLLLSTIRLRICGQDLNLAHSKLSIGISYSSDYCYKSLKTTDSQFNNTIHLRDSIETGRFGYTLGIPIVYKINQKWSLQSGIFYADKGEKYSTTFTDTSRNPTLPNKVSYVNHYTFLNLPFKADYFLMNSKFSVYITLGISANISLNQKRISTSTFSNGSTQTSTVNYDKKDRIYG